MSLATDDSRIDELLLEWEERRQRGEETSAREICMQCPELEEELARRIGVLLRWEKQASLMNEEMRTTSNGTGRVSIRSASAASLRATLGDLEFLAHGGLGEVYRARHEELGRDVALKLIRGHRVKDAESCRRFAWEARITARLEHPG